jgi:hypothetical protein
MAKDVGRFRRKRLQRFFIGLHGPGSEIPRWIEVGHLLQGVEIMLKRIVERDGSKHVVETNCGWIAEGALEPAQNSISDYRQYVTHLAGKRPIAFLTGDDQLWLFDYKKISSKEFTDNRLSISTDIGYKSPRNAAAASISGWTPGFQILSVKNFRFEQNKFFYTVTAQVFDTDVVTKMSIGI